MARAGRRAGQAGGEGGTGQAQAGQAGARKAGDGRSGSRGAKAGPPKGVTPVMAQYIEIKAANPDCLLFYRMGDFFELFFEDAVAASRALGIHLTKRGKHMGEDIPMCGVPVARADEYLQKLIARGFRVAVCEQLEDPAEAKKRGSKAVVRRDVIRLVTPGTLTEDSLLDAGANNYLTALFRAPAGRGAKGGATAGGSKAGAESGDWALASADISTGAFLVASLAAGELAGELAKLSPSEVIAADSLMEDAALRQMVEACGAALTPVPAAYFDSRAGKRDLEAQLGVADLAAYGQFTRPELAACGALLKYIALTQVGRRPALRPPQRSDPGTTLGIDAATRANLELTRTLSGERRGSLLHAMDRTVTGAGARELASRLASPLTDPAAINVRLDAVAFLLAEPDMRARLRAALANAPDLARALSRIALGRAGPRDLGAIRDGLAAADAALDTLSPGASPEESDPAAPSALPSALAEIAARLAGARQGLRDTLEAALEDELPIHRRDGGFVRAGYREDLDENRRLRDQSRQVLAALQAKYQDETGIRSLKVRHNNVLGYFIEVTAVHGQKLREPPLEATFRHRQTLANAVRFTTAELAETEARITSAGERALAIEQEVFQALAAEIMAAEDMLGALGLALAELDVFAGLAELAEEQGYVRPRLDDSLAFDIRGGRHPVVEQALARAGGESPFIENDCILGGAPAARRGGGTSKASAPLESGDDEPNGDLYPSGFDEQEPGRELARLWILTGPNMAGKSTFLRQNALIAIMAQMGSYVPARRAHIGVLDRVFSRVGAADDLARGRSTFMVEMVETAAILNQASERSLVILDEIGRGTATFDGLSIAWATIEYLHDVNRSRALFATHYHELTALAAKLAHVRNATIEVREFQSDIVFLHKVVPGAADRSYGVHVARLAGLPPAVIARAGEVLEMLEESDRRVRPEDLVADLPLFTASAQSATGPGQDEAPETAASALEDAVRAIDPDGLTPREALERLYALKALLEGES